MIWKCHCKWNMSWKIENWYLNCICQYGGWYFDHLVILESEQDRDLDQGDSCLLSLDLQMMSWNQIWWSKNKIVDSVTDLDVLFYKIKSHHILRSSRNNNVGVFLGWKTKLFEGRLDKSCVLVKNMLQLSASLRNITEHTSDESKCEIIK